MFCALFLLLQAFTASSILRTHIRQHSGERPFKCKHCGKAFASHAAHDSHVRRTHAKDKPYSCSLCGVSFQDPLLLLSQSLSRLWLNYCLCLIISEQLTFHPSYVNSSVYYTGSVKQLEGRELSSDRVNAKAPLVCAVNGPKCPISQRGVHYPTCHI